MRVAYSVLGAQVKQKGISYPDAYAFVHQRFSVEKSESLTAEQIPQAVEYIHSVAMEIVQECRSNSTAIAQK